MRRLFAKKKIEARLMELREIDPVTGCWIWLGRWHKQGYGLTFVTKSNRHNRGSEIVVHRVAAFLWLDVPLKSEQQVIHTCECNACFNPEHLLVLENKSEAFKYFRKKAPHNRAERNNRASITLEQALDIRDAIIAGVETPKNIAERVGCARDLVYKIKHRRTWTYIWDKGFDKKLYSGKYGKTYGKRYAVRQMQESGSISNHVDVQRRYAVSGVQGQRSKASKI